MGVIPLDDSMTVYNNVMNLRQKKIAYTQSKIALADRQAEFSEKYSDVAVATRKKQQGTDLIKAYIDSQDAVETATDKLGLTTTRKLIDLGERSVVGKGSVSIADAMRLQRDTKNDHGEIIQQSYKAQQDIGNQLGLSADVAGRVNNGWIENANRARGGKNLRPDTNTMATTLTKALFKDEDITDDDLDLPEIADGSELSQKLQRVQAASMQAFSKLENQPDLSPTERIMASVSAGQDGEDLTPQQTKLLLTRVIDSIDAVQNTKVQKALVESSIQYQKNIEAGGAFIAQTLGTTAQTEPELAASQLMNVVGSWEMINLIGTTKMEFGEDAAWEELGTTIAERKKAFGTDWGSYSPSQQFAMYVDATIDNAVHKANILQDNGLINGAMYTAELMQRANRSGELFEKFPAMKDMFQEGFDNFQKGQGISMDKRQQTITKAAQSGARGTASYLDVEQKPLFVNSNYAIPKDKETYEKGTSTLMQDKFIRDRAIKQGSAENGNDYVQVNADVFDLRGNQQLSDAHNFALGEKTAYPLVFEGVDAPVWDLSTDKAKYEAVMPTLDAMKNYTDKQWEDDPMLGGKKGYNLKTQLSTFGYDDVMKDGSAEEKKSALLATLALTMQTSDTTAQRYENESVAEFSTKYGVPEVIKPYLKENGKFKVAGFTAIERAVFMLEEQTIVTGFAPTYSSDISKIETFVDKIEKDSRKERERCMTTFSELTPTWQRFEDKVTNIKQSLSKLRLRYGRVPLRVDFSSVAEQQAEREAKLTARTAEWEELTSNTRLPTEG